LTFHHFEQKHSSEGQNSQTKAKLEDATGVRSQKTELVKMSEIKIFEVFSKAVNLFFLNNSPSS
jgi:hypothetical protein